MNMDKKEFTLIDVTSVLITKITGLEVRTRALSELFIEKENVTKQEFEERVKLIRDRDTDELKDGLIELVREAAKEREESEK